MYPFFSPVDDILFSLKKVAGAQALPDWDDTVAREILEHFAQLAEAVIAPLNATGDAQGARLENDRVRMPDGFVKAYAQLAKGGWQGLTAPAAYGGMECSGAISAGVSEIFSGANHSMQMVCNLVPGAIQTLQRFGTEAQQAEWIPKLASGAVLSTMCLTESNAGSDLGAIRCRAARHDDNWHITGEKIFISGGDQNMSDSIMHLVLARSGTVEDGLKGLSLFLCPAQPRAHVTRIEGKLGLHASPTCHMVFDGARAELIGVEGAGLKAMFTLMNHARIDVALQGVAHAARAAQIATAYANERQQGRTVDNTPAYLGDHADVRRMLDQQQILAIGTRAMCHISLIELEHGLRPELANFLTPLCKIIGSEAGIKAADLGIQIMGGYGYLADYGMEQIWRDARITAIYEGTNGIHARSLVTRGLRPGGGAKELAHLITELSGNDPSIAHQLVEWTALAKKLVTSDDATSMARNFTDVSSALLQAAVWTKIKAVAGHDPRSLELKRLAQKVLQKTEGHYG